MNETASTEESLSLHRLEGRHFHYLELIVVKVYPIVRLSAKDQTCEIHSLDSPQKLSYPGSCNVIKTEVTLLMVNYWHSMVCVLAS